MIPRFLTDVTVKFNPFSPRSKAARIFLSLLPPNARQTMKISVAQLPKTSEEKATLAVKFSKWCLLPGQRGIYSLCGVYRQTVKPKLTWAIEDGKEMKFDPETVKIKKVIEEVDRHSRLLARQEELTSS
jgi:large subunit ribosomal protein L53